MEPTWPMPALLTRMSRNSSCASAAAMDSGLVTSRCSARAEGSVAARASAAGKLMSAIQTSAPARASSFTVASPMPLAPPVTRAMRWSRRNGSAWVCILMDALTLSRIGHHFQIRAGGFGDGFGVSGVDGGEVDEVAAHAEGARAGLDEAFGGLQRDAAGGNELEMREGREQRLQIACAADGGAGKDLDVVCARVPGGDGLSGRERAGA